MYRKNTSGQHLGFAAINASTGAAMTGTTGFAAYRVVDGGTQASATGTVADKGNGQYDFALSQADTNGNDVSILFTLTGMVPVEKTIVTTACDPTAATNFGITSLPATAVTTNASLLTSGTGTDQVTVAAGKVLLQATQAGVTIPTVTTVTNQLAAVAVADAVLARDVANVEGTMPEHCLGTVVLATTEWAVSGTNWVVYRTDGSTPHATKPIATASGVDAIVGVG